MSTYKKDEEQLVFSYPSYQESDVVKQANALLQQQTRSLSIPVDNQEK